jgi:hypothetical protein
VKKRRVCHQQEECAEKYIGIINANCKEQEDGGGIIKRPPLKKAA